MKKVAIVMGSDSDLPIVKKAAQVLKDFGVPTELRVLSAHPVSYTHLRAHET